MTSSWQHFMQLSTPINTFWNLWGVKVPKHVARIHDDVIKWKHFPRHWPFVRGIHRSPVNSPHKGQWRGSLMFSLIWIHGWVNNREAGNLRRYRAHYDVTLMCVKNVFISLKTVKRYINFIVIILIGTPVLQYTKKWPARGPFRYSGVIMGTMASQITSLTIVYSTVCLGADQRKHQSSASLAFVMGIHRWSVTSPHKGPVTRKCFHLMTSSCYKRLFGRNLNTI